MADTKGQKQAEQMYYPYVGFHFKVQFTGEGFDSAQDTSFQSVKGLEMEVETEPLKEGGVNTYEHTLPTRVKFSTLTLERGLYMPEKSPLIKWCKQALFEFKFQPINMTVMLLNESHKPLLTWNIRHAYPKSWKIKDLNAQQGEVLIETLELQYNEFRLDPN
jgi:phage tail-like protein